MLLKNYKKEIGILMFSLFAFSAVFYFAISVKKVSACEAENYSESGETVNISNTTNDEDGQYSSSHVSRHYDCGDYNPPQPTFVDININATKIVCDSESNLPNWGAGGPDITANTANQFLSTHPNCHLESGWKFQWASSTESDPGKSFVGEVSGWHTFGVSDANGIATISVSVSSTTSYIWMREVLKDGYLPFTYPGDNDPNSAEMYCHTDVLNYDNYDKIEGPFVSGNTYYCVAFNVLKSTSPVNTPPVITLIGANPLNINVDDTFTDPGATATDLEDGNATTTAHIIVAGTVDTATTSTNILVYSVTDSGGLSASTTRTVIVSATTTPPIIPPVVPPVNPPSDGGGGGGIGGHRHPVVVGEILGATSCTYLRDYLKTDWQNDNIEVLKLQSFLNIYEKENLLLTGDFNQATFEAVQRFQIKYSGDVLNPWGNKVTTGFVYILTKKKINEIYCNTNISLSQTEQKEIEEFKTTGASVSRGIGQSTINSGQSQNQDLSIENENLNSEETNVPVINLTSSSATASGSTSDSVVRNVAISLFALPQKIFSSWKYFLIFIILIAIIIAIVRLFRDSDDDDNVSLNPMLTDEPIQETPVPKEPIESKESPVIILPGVNEEKSEIPEVVPDGEIPDEEIVVENPEEGPEEIVEETK